MRVRSNYQMMLFLICVISQLFILSTFADTGILDSVRSDYVGEGGVEDSKTAIQLAMKFIGLELPMESPKEETEEKIAVTFVLSQLKTPFFYDKVMSRTVWKITIKNVALDLRKKTREANNLFPKDFEVLIDSASGHLLEIRAQDHGLKQEELPVEVPPEQATKQLRGISFEFYTGYPSESPTISLMDALNKKIVGPVLKSKLFIANYVYYSRDGVNSRPAWVIHLLGMPSFNGTTHMRNVVDAMTGDPLRSTNIPFVAPK